MKHRKRVVTVLRIRCPLDLGVMRTLEIDWQSFKHVRVNLPTVAYVNWTEPIQTTTILHRQVGLKILYLPG